MLRSVASHALTAHLDTPRKIRRGTLTRDRLGIDPQLDSPSIRILPHRYITHLVKLRQVFEFLGNALIQDDARRIHDDQWTNARCRFQLNLDHIIGVNRLGIRIFATLAKIGHLGFAALHTDDQCRIIIHPPKGNRGFHVLRCLTRDHITQR